MGFGFGFFSAIDASLALLGLYWLIRGAEKRKAQALFQTQAASLQSEIDARARELETANAHLKVAIQVNALLALCAQHMPIGVVVTDAAGTILWANSAWEKLSGRGASEYLRHRVDEVLARFWDGFDPEDGRQLLQAGRPVTIETKTTRPDGAGQWLEIALQPVRNKGHQIVNHIVLVEDVTARREADLRLQAMNERLQFALRSSGYGIWETYLPEERVEWDERMYEMYGVVRGVFGCSLDEWFGLMHPDDVPSVRLHRQNVLDGTEKNFDIDFRILRPDGDVRFIEAHGFLLRDADGKPQRFVGLNRDITVDQKMRETLQVAEDRLELALLATNESVWDWNLATGQVYRDRRWFELVGGESTGPLIDASEWLSRVHPEDLKMVDAALDEHLQGRTPVYMSEHRLQTHDGRWIWTLDRGKVVSRDKEGRPLRMVGTQGDITARKQLEERLRHSEEISIQVSRLAQIGAWEFDIAAKSMRWEPELFRIAEVELGYQPALASMTAFFADEHAEVFSFAIEQATREGRSFDLECPFVTALGRRRWIRVFGRTELKDGQPVRVFGAVQEISARRESEDARRKLEAQLFQVQKMETLGTLAGGIAHDFNNLLTGIMGYQDLALDHLPEDDQARPCLAEARKASLRACELVEQILVFSRQTGGSERLPTDLAQIVEEARRFLRATVPATVQIQTTVAPNCGRVLADATQINQVLLNLGSNAAYAMRSGSGVLAIGLAPVELSSTQAAAHGNLPEGRYVRLTVSDTGHGMDADTKQRIFDPFFTTKAVGEGTGLGLAIVHGIVRSHGGAIEVESEPGRGTTFRIFLPSACEEVDESEAPAEPPPRGDGQVVCVVDDEQLVAQATRLTLERYGYNCVVFNSSDECLKALRREAEGCALLLSDQTMPGMTGMELSAEVRNFAPKLPIIIMSGYFSKVSAGALEQIGNISLLAKPFTAVELTRAVHAALRPAPAST
jgi:PAS domain S-box-containing protein